MEKMDKNEKRLLRFFENNFVPSCFDVKFDKKTMRVSEKKCPNHYLDFCIKDGLIFNVTDKKFEVEIQNEI